MTGSIQEKHGKLYAVLCYKDILGKPQRKWVSTNLAVRGNKKRAEAMLPDIIEEYLYLEPKNCKSILFVDYIREWTSAFFRMSSYPHGKGTRSM